MFVYPQNGGLVIFRFISGVLFNGGLEDENERIFNVPSKRDHYRKVSSSNPIIFEVSIRWVVGRYTVTTLNITAKLPLKVVSFARHFIFQASF